MPSDLSYNPGSNASDNLLALLARQNTNGASAASLSGAEPFEVLAAKTIFNATDVAGIESFLNVSLTGMAGQGYITLPAQSSDPAAPAANNIRIYADSANKFAWIGASGFSRRFDGTLTASRTFTLPDTSGTFILDTNPSAVSIAAGGANQSITLTPSGTGVVLIPGTSKLKFGATAAATLGVTADTTAGNVSMVLPSTGSLVVQGTGGAISTMKIDGINSRELLQISSSSNTDTIFHITNTGTGGVDWQLRSNSTGGSGPAGSFVLFPNGATHQVSFTSGGHILLDGLTTDGTGVLQFPASTTSAGGISAGTDTFLYRSGAQKWVFTCGTQLIETDSSGSLAVLRHTGTNGSLTIGASIALNPNNATALTLSSTQQVSVAKTFITTPSALTYASPTSVDVTLASCFTVTTVNATGSVTFNATAGGTAGQEMTILITNDATSAKTITFGTNFLSTGTLTASAASRHTSITFKSDGTSWYETGRAVLTA